MAMGLIVGSILSRSSRPQPLRFVFENDSSHYEFEAYLSPKDSTYYLFLPSCANNGHLIFQSNWCQLIINGTTYRSGDQLPDFHLGIIYDFFFSRGAKIDSAKLCIVKSENIPFINVHINENTLERIFLDKDYSGLATFDLFSPEGKPMNNGRNNQIYLKGRGNSTWWNPKKPLLLTLAQPDSLLGMPPGQKWVLLANAFDLSNLRNKIALDFVSGLDMQWNPDCRFVELYFNGRYHGLYLLTEKIELSNHRLSLPQMPQYLFLNDIEEVTRSSGIFSVPFTGDQWASLIDCKTDRPVQLDSLEYYLKRLKACLSGDEDRPDESLENLIDINSWASKYITDELFLNGDVWRRSNYFYCMGSSPYVFYSGPVWDYDLSMGLGVDEIFALVDTNEDYPIRTMFDCPSFRRQAIELYCQKARPYCSWLLEHGLDSLALLIKDASRSNLIRWQEIEQDSIPPDYYDQMVFESVQQLRTFFERRLTILDDFYLSTKPIQSFSYETSDPGLKGFFSHVLYRPEYTLGDYFHNPSDTSLRSAVWVDSSTGIYYGIDSIPPPGSRLNFIFPSDTALSPNDTTSNVPIKWSKWLSPIFFTLLFIILFLCIGFIEFKKCSNNKNDESL
jgi:hypothetical protein